MHVNTMTDATLTKKHEYLRTRPIEAMPRCSRDCPGLPGIARGFSCRCVTMGIAGVRGTVLPDVYSNALVICDHLGLMQVVPL